MCSLKVNPAPLPVAHMPAFREVDKDLDGSPRVGGRLVGVSGGLVGGSGGLVAILTKAYLHIICPKPGFIESKSGLGQNRFVP